MGDKITIITNNVPRDVIEAWQLTAAEREQFDYLDWPAIDEGRDSESFVRYRGELIDISEIHRSMMGSFGMPEVFNGWHAYMSDSFFSGMLIRYPIDRDNPTEYRSGDVNYDYERVIVGRYYS